MWDELQKTSSLMHVAAPILIFKPEKSAQLPLKWGIDKLYRLRIYAFGIIPLGKHRIVVKKIDHRRKEILTNESGFLTKRWDHFVQVEKIDEATVRYTDQIEIQAGILTVFIWLFAHLFYRRRQRKWKLLMAG